MAVAHSELTELHVDLSVDRINPYKRGTLSDIRKNLLRSLLPPEAESSEELIIFPESEESEEEGPKPHLDFDAAVEFELNIFKSISEFFTG